MLQKIIFSVIQVVEAVETIEKIPDKREQLIKGLKIAGAATIGGIFLGGIGFFTYGIGPAVIATGVGIGGGAGVGIISNLFRKS